MTDALKRDADHLGDVIHSSGAYSILWPTEGANGYAFLMRLPGDIPKNEIADAGRAVLEESYQRLGITDLNESKDPPEAKAFIRVADPGNDERSPLETVAELEITGNACTIRTYRDIEGGETGSHSIELSDDSDLAKLFRIVIEDGR